MDFDILIPTRNRLPVLKVSLPLMLSQSRPPRRLIVVDSSDDHNEVAKTVESIASQYNIELRVIQSEAGIAFQRNIGLTHVHSPVVFIPDDDSLWFPGYTGSIMRIYERDGDGRIGSVCGSQSMSPPQSVLDVDLPYQLAWELSFAAKHRRIANPFGSFFRDPIVIECELRLSRWDAPRWLDEEVAVPSVGSTEASFRSSVVKDFGYDEILGRYSLFEDRELFLRMMDDHMPVCARRAKFYHYRSPEKRTGGIEWGVITVLNSTYIVCKHSPPGSLSRRKLRKFFYYKLLRFLAQAGTKHGRNRVIGTLRALSVMSQLMSAKPEDLPLLYVKLRNRCLGSTGPAASMIP